MVSNQAEIFENEWAYEYDSMSGINGVKITSFNKKLAEKDLKLEVFADSEEHYASIVESFHESCEKDIINLTPGKLFVNNYYIQCYISGSQYGEYDENFYAVEKTISIVTEYPFWCQDVVTSFYKKEEALLDGETLDYPRVYPYDYKRSDDAGSNLLNNHYAPCDFQMCIQGACVEPDITIGGHLYEVKTTVSDNEYLIIDSRFNTVKKYDKYGNEFDVFNSRNKESDLFQKIPVGNSLTVWSGEFSFDVTLFYERSEPKWTL